MAKARLFDLQETKGIFQLKGIVTGHDKDTFYKESKTKTQKDMRRVNFGVTFDREKTTYISMQGMTQDKVYFSKQVKKGEKGETVSVAWADRHTFKRDDFGLIGTKVGVKKTVDGKGNTVNDKKVLTDFDACKEVGENLKDNQSVFIKGKLEFSSYKADNGEMRKSTKLVPNQISLCKDVDFGEDEFEAVHDFTQTIIFTGIDQEKENDKPTGRFVVSAKIITYSTIEDAEFIVADSSLANIFRKNLKPYYAIEVWGKLDVASQTEEVEDEDDWGESNNMNKQLTPTRREFVITGAKRSSVDKETYSEEAIEAATAKINASKNASADYADNDNEGWGNSSSLSSDDDSEAWG